MGSIPGWGTKVPTCCVVRPKIFLKNKSKSKVIYLLKKKKTSILFSPRADSSNSTYYPVTCIVRVLFKGHALGEAVCNLNLPKKGSLCEHCSMRSKRPRLLCEELSGGI